MRVYILLYKNLHTNCLVFFPLGIENPIYPLIYVFLSNASWSYEVVTVSCCRTPFTFIILDTFIY